MSPAVAGNLLLAAAAYLLLGGLIGLALLGRGLARLDPGFAAASPGLRLIVLPATVLLWPLLLGRWLAGKSSPPGERTAHRLAAGRGGDPGDTGSGGR